jgi:hypothetical protein
MLKIHGLYLPMNITFSYYILSCFFRYNVSYSELIRSTPESGIALYFICCKKYESGIDGFLPKNIMSICLC